MLHGAIKIEVMNEKEHEEMTQILESLFVNLGIDKSKLSVSDYITYHGWFRWGWQLKEKYDEREKDRG